MADKRLVVGGAVAVFGLALGLWWAWPSPARDAADAQSSLRGQASRPVPKLVPPLPPEPPLAPRLSSAFPGAELVRLADLPTQIWRPVQRQTAWLVIYAVMPPSLDASQGVVDLVRAVWQRQDLGAAVMMAQAATATGQPDRKLGDALDALLALPDQAGRPIVLLGVGVQAQAALRLASDPRIRAVALVDPDQAAVPPADDAAWPTVVGNKHALLAGPETAAGTLRRLGDRMGHLRTVVLGQQQGVAWLGPPDHRSAVVGWLASLLTAPP